MPIKRLFIFAAYDKDNVIDETLLYYLRTLSEFGDIVFTMDNDTPKHELKKLDNIPNILHVSAKCHGEYDFGSYKRGYIWAHDKKILKKYDWVYFVNDSVYLLANPARMIDWLEHTNHKMIGVSENNEWKHHVQSWFMGFAPEIFMSDWFYGFWDTVRTEDKDSLVLHCEVGLSKLVQDNGFSFGAYTSYLLTARSYYGMEQYMPFMKKSIVTANRKYAKKVNQVLSLPEPSVAEAIRKNIARTKNTIVPFSKRTLLLRKIGEVFWDKTLNNKRKIFGINVFFKDFYHKSTKHLYIFPLKMCIRKNRRGILFCIWGFHVLHLQRKKYSATPRQIARWVSKHAKSDIRGVVYTCMTGDYDNIITHRYLNPEYDYVCFTDNQELLKRGHPVWQMRPLPYCDGDNIMNSRFPKLNPHKILKEYEYSLYVDSNVSIESKHLFSVCEKSQKNLLIPRHPDRDCLYDECQAVYDVKKDTPDNVFRIRKLLSDSGYPRNMGLTENNIIWRKHNDKTVISIDSQWWDMFNTYSRRDQLTLGYILWKHKIPFQDIYMPVQQNWDYVVSQHTKK